MTNELQVFNFNQNQIRTDLRDGEPWFCLADCASALGIKNAATSVKMFEKGVGKTYILTSGGQQEIKIINEPNLYRLIFRSNKPQAQAFADWVYSEVLPSIRKTGGYVVPQPAQIDMKAIGGIVKKCATFAVKQAIAEMFATPLEIDEKDLLQKQLYNISDKDMMDTFSNWYVSKNYKLHQSLWDSTKTIEQLECKLRMVEKAIKS